MVGSRWRRVLGVLLAVPALALATACTAEPNASWRGGDGAPAGSSAPAGSGLLAITPATGTAGVPVLDPVTVTAQDATLQSVALTNEAGKQVAGEYDADRHSWHSTEPLGYGKAYTVNATATNVKGEQVTQTSRFTTLKPAKLAMPYLRANQTTLLGTGKTFGVGRAIVERLAGAEQGRLVCPQVGHGELGGLERGDPAGLRDLLALDVGRRRVDGVRL